MSETDKFRDAAPVIDMAAQPVGTVNRYEDQQLPSAVTALFTGKAYTFWHIKVKQNANAGSAVQYGTVYVVFNSADPTTDLNSVTARIPINIGEDLDGVRPSGSIASCHYKCANTSADVVLQAEFK